MGHLHLFYKIFIIHYLLLLLLTAICGALILIIIPAFPPSPLLKDYNLSFDLSLFLYIIILSGLLPLLHNLNVFCLTDTLTLSWCLTHHRTGHPKPL